MNDARFTGNLTRDPEAKAMSNGKLRCTFTLAVTRPYTNQQGQRDADFIQFVAYEKNAELAQKYLAKGRKILVISHVKTGSYEKDGKRIYTTEFVVDKIEFLSSEPFPKKRTRKFAKKQNESLSFWEMLVQAARCVRRLASNCAGECHPNAECGRTEL